MKKKIMIFSTIFTTLIILSSCASSVDRTKKYENDNKVLSLKSNKSILDEFSFKVDNGKSYSISEYSEFIENEIRSRISRTSKKHFNVKVMRNRNESTDELVIQMEPTALYFEEVDGHELEPDVSKYTNDDLLINNKNFVIYFDKSLDFEGLPKKEKQNTLKLFAFVIAEGARFVDVEKAVSHIFKDNCTFHWKDYMLLVRRWKTMSIFSNERGIPGRTPAMGGTRAFLITPISEKTVKLHDEAAKAGWLFIRYDYNKQEKDVPVNIPDEDSCVEN